MRFRFVAEEAAQFPVSLLCRTLGVTRQGYYAWRRRPPSARAVADQQLSGRIGQIHDEVAGIYGAPRIHAELRLAHGMWVADIERHEAPRNRVEMKGLHRRAVAAAR